MTGLGMRALGQAVTKPLQRSGISSSASPHHTIPDQVPTSAPTIPNRQRCPASSDSALALLLKLSPLSLPTISSRSRSSAPTPASRFAVRPPHFWACLCQVWEFLVHRPFLVVEKNFHLWVFRFMSASVFCPRTTI